MKKLLLLLPLPLLMGCPSLLGSPDTAYQMDSRVVGPSVLAVTDLTGELLRGEARPPTVMANAEVLTQLQVDAFLAEVESLQGLINDTGVVEEPVQ